mmetsp:Transcript_6199/g.11361  ORF Transcript_6199/g.11361 Transcript_6199/m.11361 type:complete len:316 (-) Transcript_6199:62-1009(-)
MTPQHDSADRHREANALLMGNRIAEHQAGRGDYGDVLDNTHDHEGQGGQAFESSSYQQVQTKRQHGIQQNQPPRPHKVVVDVSCPGPKHSQQQGGQRQWRLKKYEGEHIKLQARTSQHNFADQVLRTFCDLRGQLENESQHRKLDFTMCANTAARHDDGKDERLLPAKALKSKEARGKENKGNVALLAELQEGNTGIHVGLIRAGQRDGKHQAERYQESEQQPSILDRLVHGRVEGWCCRVQQHGEGSCHGHVNTCKVDGMRKAALMHQVLVESDQPSRHADVCSANQDHLRHLSGCSRDSLSCHDKKMRKTVVR